MNMRVVITLVMLTFLGAVPAEAQECGIYVEVDEAVYPNSAVIRNATYANCSPASTWAEAHISLPGGRHADDSASGAIYAEALASISIDGEAGEGWFSIYSEATDLCSPYNTSYWYFEQSFNLYNNTPVVTGISPRTWVAGQTTSGVSFTGRYFGTNAPILTFSPSGGISYSLVSYNDSQIVADVTVSSGTPDETVAVTVTNNGYGGLGFLSNGGSVSPSSPPAMASVRSAPTTMLPEVTVIAWVNGQAPDLATLPSGANPTLISNLNSSGFNCTKQVFDWAVFREASNLNNQTDRDYANAFLVKHSANAQPPTTVSPQSALAAGDFRLFNAFGGGQAVAKVGRTPDPCQWLNATIAGWVDEGQASQNNGAAGISPSGKVYMVAEGRIGLIGQLGSQTINQGRTVPWVYAVVRVDASGYVAVTHATFPTYSVYVNGVLHPELSSTQSTVKAFVTGYAATNENDWSPVP